MESSEIIKTPEKKKRKFDQTIDFDTEKKVFYSIQSNKQVTYNYVKQGNNDNNNLTDMAKAALNSYDENGTFNKELFNNKVNEMETELSQMSKSPSVKGTPGIFKSPSPNFNKSSPESQHSLISFHKPIEEEISKRNLLQTEYENKIRDMQSEFNDQLPELLSKNQIDIYYNEYQTYGENQTDNNNPPIANPQSCFTVLEINSKLLFDVLNLKKMCYKWRNMGPMFGISGELSIAGLTILAMKTLRVICESDTLNKIKNLKADRTKPISWNNTNAFSKDFETYFNDAFKNIDSKKREGENRDNLDSGPCKLLTTLMLNVMEEFKRNYFALINLKTTQDEQYLNFLGDSFLLLERLILIKSSLDVTQAVGLNELVIYNSFCLFNSYDYSAVLNTPYCPVLASGKFPGFEEINYIYDDIAIFEFFDITKTDPKDLTEGSISKKLHELFQTNGFIYSNFYKNIDVAYTSENSKLFIKVMNTQIQGKSVYQNLRDLASQNISDGFDVKKTRYETVSKLFLNYNVSRKALNFEQLTSNSRDIRAHDYANSPIRCFGISVYIKKKISDFLRIKNINLNSLNQLEKEEEIKNILKSLNDDDKKELANFILIDESKIIQNEYTHRNMTDPHFHQTPIQKNQIKYNSFLLDKSYDPLEGFIEEIKDIYILMSGQDANEFESSQEIDGLKRVLVFEQNEESRVYLNNGPLFRKDAKYKDENEATAKTLGAKLQNYTFLHNTIGIVDLCIKKGGVNRIINGILVETTITEADAAHSSLGFYTERVHIHKNGELFYNDIKLATIFSGDFKNKYEKKEEMETDIASFKLLFGLNKFNITANNAIQTINYLISSEVQDEINDYIEKIKEINNELGTDIEKEYNNLNHNIQSYLNQKPTKGSLAKNVYDICSTLIRTFIQRVNTALGKYIGQNQGQKCNVIPLIDKIGKKLYFILWMDNEKYFTYIKKLETDRPQRGKKRGGGKDEECFVKNNQTETKNPVNLFRGKFGSYIDVVNGKFVFKEIQTEEELKNIEMRLGIYNDLKEEKQQPQTTPIKNNNPSFTSPTSVTSVEMTTGKQEAGKTIKRRHRIKRKTRKTRRIKNKNKHRMTVKLIKKRSKFTKGRKPRH
jgi:hypothetical protein